MTRFRPCIDLHQGQVKQIVGGSLRDEGAGPVENFVSDKPPAWFAEAFRADQLTGGHVIKLGQGNDEAAREALSTWPGGLQIGGGTITNVYTSPSTSLYYVDPTDLNNINDPMRGKWIVRRDVPIYARAKVTASSGPPIYPKIRS